MTRLSEEIAAVHARIAEEHRAWRAAQPKSLKADLPPLPAFRSDLADRGHTVSIERHPLTQGRVVAERVDGRLISTQQDEDPTYDECLIRQADGLAAELDATFVKDALDLPPCPSWCIEDHMFADEDHHGPGAVLETSTGGAAFIIALEQKPGEKAAIYFRPWGDGEHKVTVEGALEVRDALDDVVRAFQEATKEDGQ